MEWTLLFNSQRRKDKDNDKISGGARASLEVRTEIERDYDRVLFSTPLRRLSDKTQVFPLDANDSVRTRLTHSLEVSNLARSIGTNLVYNTNIFAEVPNASRDIPALLATAGLCHDLGNPPFGHQGEAAIQHWFTTNSERLRLELDDAMEMDFLKFEGNAQTLRLLTRLQIISDNFGLNLTYASLAALLKYPTASNSTNKENVSTKKHGFFQSEKDIVQDIWESTGLREGVRHPITFIMEACDDIAYSVLDAEDAIKKKLVSYSDLISFLETYKDDASILEVLAGAKKHHDRHKKLELSPWELNDVSMQMFRVSAIGVMVRAVSDAFQSNLPSILNGDFKNELIEVSAASRLCERLKEFDKVHAFRHRSVLEVELIGFNVINGLMDIFWEAILDRKDTEDIGSKRKKPFSAYVYGRISENYRRIAESSDSSLPIKYRECQLLTDMISGMTDSFAIDLYRELSSYKNGTNSP